MGLGVTFQKICNNFCLLSYVIIKTTWGLFLSKGSGFGKTAADGRAVGCSNALFLMELFLNSPPNIRGKLPWTAILVILRHGRRCMTTRPAPTASPGCLGKAPSKTPHWNSPPPSHLPRPPNHPPKKHHHPLFPPSKSHAIITPKTKKD